MATPEVPEEQTRLEFTEEMKGYVTTGESDYDRGFQTGRELGNSLMVHLTIKIDDVDRFVTDPRHEATAEGYARCAALGGDLPVERGVFNLFVGETDPARKRMLYRLFLRGAAGESLTMTGFKEIKDDPGFDVWRDSTTLFTRFLRGHVSVAEEAQAEAVASGIIQIHPLDFLRQMTTFEADGPTAVARAAAFTKFGKLFLGALWEVYVRDFTASSPKN
jgi:cholesterol oxidase